MYKYQSNINRSTIIHGISLWIVDCSPVHNIALHVSYKSAFPIIAICYFTVELHLGMMR